jgi:Cu/Ag efflux protein CusF
MKNVRNYIPILLMFAALGAHAAENSGPLQGTIAGRDTATNHLTVAHGEVKGLMGAMTMSYEVRGQKVASLPKDGAQITATLHKSDGTYWLTDVREKHAMAGHDMAQMSANRHGMSMPAPPAEASKAASMSGASDPTADLLMRQASGTSMNPGAAPMHMSMLHRGDWTLMLHGLAFISQVVESGPRGNDKLFSTNWIMGMASRPLGGGQLMLRAMLSLEPITVGDKYPELFQTGETIHGRPIVDAQHPHDFVMELAAEYAHPLTNNTIGFIYAAPFGDPALGPVAYPHRASAAEIPQAALGHHVQDSTHIAGSVLTIGAQSGTFGYALSGFHGREPDENRWDIDTGKIDSWAARVTFDPNANWSAQLSTGHLHQPEAAEPVNVQRTTASVAYSTSRIDTSLIFGHNKKTAGHDTTSFVAEGVLHVGGVHYITGRGEIVDKDELLANENLPPAVENPAYRIKALTAGYSRDLLTRGPITGAIGANVTLYSVPAAIRNYYGSNPRALYFFVRLRGHGDSMHGMHM